MTGKFTRRGFGKLAAAGGAFIAAPAVWTGRARADNGVVYVNTWGGSWTEAEKAAFFDPFTEATGIDVRTVAPVSYAKLRAQVETGVYEWDVTSIRRSNVLRAHNNGYVEPIPWDIVDRSNIPEDSIYSDTIGYCVLGTNLAYRSDRFPNGGPQSWADFWDVERFPGKRSLYKDPIRTVAFALKADGVPDDEIYPMDLDRAFAKLDEIKPHIRVWWTQGNQSQQLIRDGEVDMMSMWNARASEVKDQGYPVELVWNGAVISQTQWLVAKGAPNAENAFRFIEFAVQPEQQAIFSNRLYYGPTNPAAFDYISDDIATRMPSYPPNAAQAVEENPDWESANLDEVEERFAQWLAS